ncbi:MAG: FIST N-terminal domain-containing protein [Candidatus Thermoplasmatota archaeon]
MFDDEDVDAAVGMTRKWDAREAGREVARDTIKNLKTPPSFVVLFSTIHYKDHGGFQEFLDGVWDVIPEGTPLIGGTVVGFINNYGCYTRGASALAVSYTNMDISIGYGKNTKRNPQKAAKNCVEMINDKLEKSNYKNNFLLSLVAGPELMAVPGQGYKKYIDSGFMSKFITLAFGMSQYLFQKGVAREDEIFEKIVKKLSSYKMILGTSFDDYKGINHYQFFENKILTNSIVSMGVSTNLNLSVNSTHGMKKTDIDLRLTKLSKNGHIIHEINNRPAVPELKRILNWPDGFLDEKTMLNKILYYPLSGVIHNSSG